MKRICIAATAILFASTAASAGSAAADWQGPYIGATAGGVQIDNTATDLTQYFVDEGPEYNLESRGFIGGLTAGYNLQSGSLVLGAEADFSYSAAGDDKFHEAGVNGLTQEAELDWLGTVRGRLGLDAGGALLFVTGGLAIASMNNKIADLTLSEDPVDPEVTFSGSGSRTGYTYGGGVEYAFNEVWSLKVEGLYYNLEDDTRPVVEYGVVYPSEQFKFEDKGYLVRAGLNFGF